MIRGVLVAALLTAGLAAPGSAATPAPPVAYAADLDGDGRDDLVRPGAGALHERVAFGTADGTFATETVPLRGSYRTVLGDFDGDGRGDVLHYAPGPARDAVWYGGADRGLTAVPLSIDGAYRPVTGDFDGDGRDDVLWHAAGSAPDYVWRGRATRTFGATRVRADAAGAPVAGDFDADGRVDLRWPREVRYGTPTGFDARPAAPPASGHVPLAADLDGEGTDDVLWYSPATGAAVAELSPRDRSVPRRVTLTLPAGATLVAGDLDGDRAADVLAYGRSSVVAYGSLAGPLSTVPVSAPAGARPVVGDYDGDRDADVYWAGATRDELWRGDPARRLAASPVVTRPNRVPAQDPAVWRTSYAPYGYVAHALGSIDGNLYTNSLEAFRESHAKGFRVFEVDLVTLADGTILAAHDGTESSLGLTKSYKKTTYDEVRGRRFAGKYTVLTGHDLLALLRKHRDVYLVLDTKWDREAISARMLTAAAADPQVARRLLPHVAGQADLDAIRRVYPLQHYVVALYRTQIYGRFDDPEVTAFVRRVSAPAVMMWWRTRDRADSLAANSRRGRRYETAFADALRAAGAVTYVHSTADTNVMRDFALRGIGVYSDGPYGAPQVPAVPLVDPTGGAGV